MEYLKTLAAFITILILTRILGKKQLSQMTFFNYVTGITIGSMAANIISSENNFLNEMKGLIFWCILVMVLDYIDLKLPKVSILIDGQPSILIKGGILQKGEMKKARITLEEISMMLREQNIFTLKEVDYAILEPNGKLSVLKKQGDLEVTKSDMKITMNVPRNLPTQVIIDGKLQDKNLTELNLDKDWLNQELQKKNIHDIRFVFYAEIQDDGTLYISPQNNK